MRALAICDVAMRWLDACAEFYPAVLHDAAKPRGNCNGIEAFCCGRRGHIGRACPWRRLIRPLADDVTKSGLQGLRWIVDNAPYGRQTSCQGSPVRGGRTDFGAAAWNV